MGPSKVTGSRQCVNSTFFLVLDFREASRLTSKNGWAQNVVVIGSIEIDRLISASHRRFDFFKVKRTESLPSKREFYFLKEEQNRLPRR